MNRPITTDLIDRILQKDFRLIILEGDCRYWLPQLPIACVDLTITDPPYESLERHRAKGTTTRLKKSKASSNEWFNIISNTELTKVLRYIFKAQKENTNCRIFCDSETEHVLQAGFNPFTGQNFLVDGYPSLHSAGWDIWPSWTWLKTKKDYSVDCSEPSYDDLRSGMGYHGRRSTERILYLEKGKRKINNLSAKDVVVGPRASVGEYPTQKPRSALLPLVECHGVQDGILLDPFAGSGRIALIAEEVFNMGSILIDVNVSWIMDHLVPLYANVGVYVFRQGTEK